MPQAIMRRLAQIMPIAHISLPGVIYPCCHPERSRRRSRRTSERKSIYLVEAACSSRHGSEVFRSAQDDHEGYVYTNLNTKSAPKGAIKSEVTWSTLPNTMPDPKARRPAKRLLSDFGRHIPQMRYDILPRSYPDNRTRRSLGKPDAFRPNPPARPADAPPDGGTHGRWNPGAKPPR